MIRFLAGAVLVLGLAGGDRTRLVDVQSELAEAGAVRIESSMVLETSYLGRVERSRPLEAVYVVAPADEDGPRAMLRMNGYRTSVDGDAVHIAHEDVHDAYVRLPKAKSPLKAVRDAFRSLPDPMLDLVLDEAWPAAAGSVVDSRDGEIVLSLGAFDRLTLLTDETGRVVQAIHDRRDDPGLPEGMRLRTTWAYAWAPLPPDEADAAIRFDRSQRQRLDDVAALAVAAEGAPQADSTPSGPTPRLELSALDGTMVRLEDLRGQVVVLDFWATWCAPCRRALRSMQGLAREYERTDSPVRFLAVNVRERGAADSLLDRVARFTRANDLELEILLDRSGVVADEWSISSIPVTIVIDADGGVVQRWDGFGAGTAEAVRAEIDRLLAEMTRG